MSDPCPVENTEILGNVESVEFNDDGLTVTGTLTKAGEKFMEWLERQ